MVRNITKISQKMKKKILFSTEKKKVIEWEKIFLFPMFEKFSLSKQKMWEEILETFDFPALHVSSWNIRSFVSLETNFLSRNFENVFFEGAFF